MTQIVVGDDDNLQDESLPSAAVVDIQRDLFRPLPLSMTK